VSKHPFRVAMETNANKEDLGKLFAADAVIEAPMLTKPVKGADDVLNIISHVAKLAGPITYTLELRDSKQTRRPSWSTTKTASSAKSGLLCVHGP
jgi:hypothetical protein